MSEQNNQPNYVVCNCQHCDGHIEFNANELEEENSIIPCPHCGLETKLFIPQEAKISPDSDLPAVKREGFFCGDDGNQETKCELNPPASQEVQSFVPSEPLNQPPVRQNIFVSLVEILDLDFRGQKRKNSFLNCRQNNTKHLHSNSRQHKGK
jgi:hypothetical protein